MRGIWGVQVLDQGMLGATRVYMSWSKGCEGYVGCTGPGPRDVRGSWGVGVPGVYRSWGKGCEGQLGCTGPGGSVPGYLHIGSGSRVFRVRN